MKQRIIVLLVSAAVSAGGGSIAYLTQKPSTSDRVSSGSSSPYAPPPGIRQGSAITESPDCYQSRDLPQQYQNIYTKCCDLQYKDAGGNFTGYGSRWYTTNGNFNDDPQNKLCAEWGAKK
ncbi:MAG: hypothetical protein ACKO3K_18245 [Cuspidothrix sp.]